MLLFAGCAGGKTRDDIKPLNPNADTSNEEENGNDTYQEVDVQDNNADTQDKKDDKPVDTSSGEEIEDDNRSEQENGLDTDSSQGPEEDTASEVIIQEGNKAASEYDVVESGQPEDETSYTTNLVFIRQEEDLWRVVDRLGNVYRVSTSYEKVEPGIVNVGAKVTNEDGDIHVSLSRDYKSYAPFIVETSEDEAPKAVAEAVLKAWLADAPANAAISNYTLGRVKVEENIGKGIVKASLVFDVDPAKGSTVWGDQGAVKGAEYKFTLFGYDTTWILPSVPPLYYMMDQSADLEELSNEESDVKSNIDENETTKDEVNKDETTEADTSADDTLADEDKSNVSAASEMQQVILAGTNSVDYREIFNYDGKVYVLFNDDTTKDKAYYKGIGVYNSESKTYRNLYKGDTVEGFETSSDGYVFTNDNLLEIDLNTGSVRIASTLPSHLDFELDKISVVESDADFVKIEVQYADKLKTYIIDIASGETTEE